MPFPENHLNDFSNDLNDFPKSFGCFRQIIGMNLGNDLNDFVGRTETKGKKVVKRLKKGL